MSTRTNKAPSAADVKHTDFFPLPSTSIKRGIRNGRVPYESYQRGRMISDHLVEIHKESLFQEASQQKGMTMLTSAEKRTNIYLILTRFFEKLSDRNIVEFGSYKGGSALFMALILREIAPEAKVYALDTFEGMPVVDKSIDAHHRGDFRDTSLDALCRRIDELKLTNLIPVKGLFQDTFPNLAPNERFGLAHIDADIYSAVRFAQDAVWPRMTEGGYVVYDDPNFWTCLGATEALEEFIQEKKIHSEQIWPHFVFRVGLGA